MNRAGKQIVSSIYAFCPFHTPGGGSADGDFSDCDHYYEVDDESLVMVPADKFRSRFVFPFS